MDDATETPRARRPVDRKRDHVRGRGLRGMVILVYGDFLCPYCRRLRLVLERLRGVLGDTLGFAFRHFPNERVHPGAELLARAAEAAGRQGKFWEMYDALFKRQPPLGMEQALEIARDIGLNIDRFRADLDDKKIEARVQEDIALARADGVSGTPTIFVGGLRYDGAWDFHSLLDVLKRPVGRKVQQTARAFANLPASAGIVLLAAALAALVAANTPLASLYSQLIGGRLAIGSPGNELSLSIADWVSEGLMALFFLVVGLEIRREVVSGELRRLRTALLPVVAAIGGSVVPALVYLAFNRGATTAGWSVPTATNIAFALGILAVLGDRIPSSLKVFVAAFAVMDDIMSILVLAIFYRSQFHPEMLIGAAAAVAALVLLNRSRIYAIWPYVFATAVLWVSLHAAGVQAALSGVILAAFLPTRPTPTIGPLLGQAATALSELEHAEKDAKQSGDTERPLQEDPVWEWASRNLSAASDRLLSPAEGVERAVSPWSSYAVLPLFAFCVAGIPLAADFGAPGARGVLAGVALGLALGKPLGIAVTALIAVKARIADSPDSVSPRAFLGMACLCGFGDSFSLVLAEHAFPDDNLAAVAKIGVLAGSALSAAIGTAILLTTPATMTRSPKTEVSRSPRAAG